MKSELSSFLWWLEQQGIDVPPLLDDELFNSEWIAKDGISYLYEVFMEEQKTEKKIDSTIKVMQLSEAMVQEGQPHHKIRIKYVKKSGDIEDYEILVLDISDNVCYAMDKVTDDLKEFNIDRITEIVNVEEKGE